MCCMDYLTYNDLYTPEYTLENEHGTCKPLGCRGTSSSSLVHFPSGSASKPWVWHICIQPERWGQSEDWYQPAVDVAYGPELAQQWRSAALECPLGFAAANLIKVRQWDGLNYVERREMGVRWVGWGKEGVDGMDSRFDGGGG